MSEEQSPITPEQYEESCNVHDTLVSISEELGCTIDQIPNKVTKMLNAVGKLEKDIENLKKLLKE